LFAIIDSKPIKEMRATIAVALAQFLGAALLIFPRRGWCFSFQLSLFQLRPASSRYSSQVQLNENNMYEELNHVVEQEVENEIARSLGSVDAFNATTAVNRGPPTFRREIELLLSLKESDAAIPLLRELWKTEKEPFAAPIPANDDDSIDFAHSESNRRTSWHFWHVPKDERRLKRQIQQYPRWAQPRIQLAQLYCQEQRNIRQAFEQCLVVLELKPWHVDLPNLLMELSLQRNDFAMAITWARLRLPRLDGGSETRRQRRHAWVDRALNQAMEQLEAVEDERERARIKTTGFLVSDEATWV
jgi:hypothetical protein